jgi:NitT/TauT family transport system ATP-binding protein
VITGHELPDLSPPAAPLAPTVFEALPEATSSEIVGLLEYLDARGGQEELFRIAGDTRRNFGHIINIVETAELLNFVDTPKRLIVLAETGREFLSANVQERKRIWRNQLLKLQLYRAVYDPLQRDPARRLDRGFVYETLALHLPSEHYDRLF